MLLLDQSSMHSSSSTIILKYFCASKNEKNPENDVQYLFRWLNEQLKKQTLDDVTIAVNALMVLLRRNDFRQIFVEADGLSQYVFAYTHYASASTQSQTYARARENFIYVGVHIFIIFARTLCIRNCTKRGNNVSTFAHAALCFLTRICEHADNFKPFF